MATTCPTPEEETAGLRNSSVRSLPASSAHRGGLGVNEPKCGHTRNGASWSPPTFDLRSFGRNHTAEGVVRDENKSGSLVQRQSLLFLAHCGLSRMLDKTGGMTLGRQDRQDSAHISPSFFVPRCWCLVRRGEARGPPSPHQCLFHSHCSWYSLNYHRSMGYIAIFAKC